MMITTGMIYEFGRRFVLLILSLQILLFDNYKWIPDYLSGNRLPLWKPYPASKSVFESKSYLYVSDNACQHEKYKTTDENYEKKMTFDYIIVGAGTAGSLIANELSKNASVTVLVIEAGDNPSTNSRVPRFATHTWISDGTWKFTAEKTSTSGRAYKNGIDMKCGKQLGGTSSINTMIWICGTDRDYNTWSKLGNPGWGYDQILPLIKNLEKNTDQNILGNGTYHGSGGEMIVSTVDVESPYLDIIEKAFTSKGYKFYNDFNSKKYNGVFNVQFTISNGTRNGAAYAYLRKCKYCDDERNNLFVVKKGYATKVLFDGQKATGVQVKTENKACPWLHFKAKHEIIISAGSINTPLLLMRSGIGRNSSLIKQGVKQIADLAVGKNLQDHAVTRSFYKMKSTATTSTDGYIKTLLKYLRCRKGELSNFGITKKMGFVNVNCPDEDDDYPNIQYIFYTHEKNSKFFKGYLERIGFDDKFVNALVEENENFEIFEVLTILLYPESKGSVEFTDNDDKIPEINANFLTAKYDIETMQKGITTIHNIVKANNSSFAPYDPQFVKFALPDCDAFTFLSEKYIKCYMTYLTGSIWHPVGTAKMGPSCDKNAVVDENLRIHGLYKIRVADASVMPKVPGGNIQCPVYAVAQKASNMIIKDHNLGEKKGGVAENKFHNCEKYRWNKDDC